MAFIFVPNPDGSFTEGDKQTNTETGVEYIYHEGAWRQLGASIEDEFDTLDERYIKLDGTTVVSDYYRLRGPNTSGGTNTFQVIEDGQLKLYNVQKPGNSNTGWAANVDYVQEYVTNQIAAIPDVDLDGYATEDYVDTVIDSTKDYIDTAIDDIQLDGALIYKGVVANEISLPADALLGEFYFATTENTYFAWNGSAWQEVGSAANVNLDEYLPLAGGTMTGELLFSVSSGSNAFRMKGGDQNLLKLWNSAGEARLEVYADKVFKLNTTVGGTAKQSLKVYENGKLRIFNHLDPNDPEDVANKRYVDTKTGAYLPLTGGTLTGTLSGQVIRSSRNFQTGYAFEVKPADLDKTLAFFRCDGRLEIKSEPTNSTDPALQVKPAGYNNGETAFKVTGDGKVKAGHSTSKPFIATGANDVLTKKYADDTLVQGKFKITSSNGNFYIEEN